MLNRTQPIFYINKFNSFGPPVQKIAKTQQKKKETPTLQSSSPCFSMGRQSSDPTMVSSSIALLQERFRQLQKVKERREEQQLQKMLSETDHQLVGVGSRRHFEPAKFSFQSDIVVPIKPCNPPADNSLSLGLNLQTKQVEYCAMKTQPSTISWPNNITTAATPSAPKSFDNSSDLDTSLHL